MLVFLHIFTGSIALLSGVISFLAQKGASTHKKTGKIFIMTMVIMALSGSLLAFINNEMLNLVVGLVTLPKTFLLQAEIPHLERKRVYMPS